MLAEVIHYLALRKSKVFSIAFGISLYLMLDDDFLMRHHLADAQGYSRAVMFVTCSVLWCYLAVETFSAIKGIATDYIFDKRRKSEALEHLTINQIGMMEIAVLVDQKNKNERLFVHSCNNSVICTLVGKGLLTEGKMIHRDMHEYRIPDFIWNSSRLKELCGAVEQRIIDNLVKQMSDNS